MKRHPRSVAFFLPAHNEEENLRHVVDEAVTYLEDFTVNFKVIVVNDGSTDGTAEVCEELKLHHGDKIQVITHSVNRGYGAALRTGIEAGVQTGFDWVGFMDSDRQFKAHYLGRMIEEAEKHEADAVMGFRIERKDSGLRRLMGKQWHCISQLILGFSAIDVDCGFKVFARPVVKEISPHLVGDSASISPELFARVQRCGFKVREYGVTHHPRQHGQSSGGNFVVIRRSFHSLFVVWRALHRKVPHGDS